MFGCCIGFGVWLVLCWVWLVGLLMVCCFDGFRPVCFAGRRLLDFLDLLFGLL